MKYFIYITISTFLFFSCRSIKEIDFKGGEPMPSLLPAIELRVDLNSFSKINAMYIERMPETPFEYTYSVDSSIYFSTLSYSLTSADKIKIFEHEMLYNITEQGQSQTQGYAVFRISKGNYNQKFAWAIISGLTLMIPNLVGMPVGSVVTDLEVQIDFYDTKQKLIKKYTASGRGKAWIALYYGYSEMGPLVTQSNVFRIAYIKAVKSAMQNIKLQIEEDYYFLSTQLK
jgi:hypothetical protein